MARAYEALRWVDFAFALAALIAFVVALATGAGVKSLAFLVAAAVWAAVGVVMGRKAKAVASGG